MIMADKKYSAGNVPVTFDQMAVIERAMDLFFEEHGVRLTRSQALAMLASRYVKEREAVLATGMPLRRP